MGMWIASRNAAALRRLSPELVAGRRLSMTALTSERFICTGSNKTDEPLKVEEADTISAPPPPSEKLLVLGGNGFVGSHICKEALNRGLTIASLSSSSAALLAFTEPIDDIVYMFKGDKVASPSPVIIFWLTSHMKARGNLLSTDSWKEALKGATSVVCSLINPDLSTGLLCPACKKLNRL
ncbi:hypothetical protein M9H77_13941 [Catharanthus roseus]|uniref:Uncharacterized protein n=1 Tax=Catharanthus roseus TaxID=4058 RepID=A0ACC0BLU3_CATRO|nr:hypothetical protein M9H77_13941 [Catharanthus roseus]